MSKRMSEEKYKSCTSSLPHMLSKVEIPWQHIRCLLICTETSQDAFLMKINHPHSKCKRREEND